MRRNWAVVGSILGASLYLPFEILARRASGQSWMTITSILSWLARFDVPFGAWLGAWVGAIALNMHERKFAPSARTALRGDVLSLAILALVLGFVDGHWPVSMAQWAEALPWLIKPRFLGGPLLWVTALLTWGIALGAWGLHATHDAQRVP
jgi:hypothetical protein